MIQGNNQRRSEDEKTTPEGTVMEYGQKTSDESQETYYTFAHTALREMVEIDPLECFKIMTSKNQRKFIDYIWREVCERCHQNEIGFSKNIQVSPAYIGCHPAVIVQMPLNKSEEAMYIAVVLRNPMDLSVVSNDDYRYFILEKDRKKAGRSGTVLCEWCSSGHYNVEEGPVADFKGFIESLKSHI